MLFVCIMIVLLPLIFANVLCFHALSWFIDTVCLFQVLYCIMHSAFNLLVLPNSMFISFFICFYERDI